MDSEISIKVYAKPLGKLQLAFSMMHVLFKTHVESSNVLLSIQFLEYKYFPKTSLYGPFFGKFTPLFNHIIHMVE